LQFEIDIEVEFEIKSVSYLGSCLLFFIPYDV